MQEIDIVSGKPPTVYRPANINRLQITFEGLREARNISDKVTRVRVTIRPEDAAALIAALTPHLSQEGPSTEH